MSDGKGGSVLVVRPPPGSPKYWPSWEAIGGLRWSGKVAFRPAIANSIISTGRILPMRDEYGAHIFRGSSTIDGLSPGAGWYLALADFSLSVWVLTERKAPLRVALASLSYFGARDRSAHLSSVSGRSCGSKIVQANSCKFSTARAAACLPMIIPDSSATRL